MSASTITLQQVADVLAGIVDIQPILSVGGYSNTTMLTIATDVMNELCAQPFPWKWNEFSLPLFYTNSWQQDYAIPGLATLASLQRGVCFNVSVNTVPKPWSYVNIVREQEQATGAWFGPCPFFAVPLFNANWIPVSSMYFGTWGGSNLDSTLGNNPGAGSVYISPVGAPSQPSNPCTQIIDANGNYLVLTTYGTEGSAAPVLPANATPGTTVSGTGATTIWTVVDPNGQGIRISPVPSQTGAEWQFRLIGQAKPVRFISLSQTLAPLPDSFEPTFRQGCLANAYQYSAVGDVRQKFAMEWPLWIRSLLFSREKEDKERDADRFVPARSIVGSGGPRGAFWGPTWPWAGPGPGWR